MTFLLNRRIGGLDLQKLTLPLFKMLFAAAAMLAACVAVQHLSIYPHHDGRPRLGRAIADPHVRGELSYMSASAVSSASGQRWTHLLPKEGNEKD